MRQGSVVIALAALVVTGIAMAGDRVSLFDGKTLDGWTVLKCEAKVDQGDLLIVAGNGLVQSKNKYKDFILEFEWKKLAEKKWDSGVYFRYSEVPKGSPWPRRYQVNLRFGMEGNLAGSKEGTSKGLVKADDWNKFKLTVKGTSAELEINGKKAWKVDSIADTAEGFIGIQAEVPQGGQFRFRNIYITTL